MLPGVTVRRLGSSGSVRPPQVILWGAEVHCARALTRSWRPACVVPVCARSDAHGQPIDRLALAPVGQRGYRVSISLHPALLYWANRRQWMWHKKWSLPTITVRIERDTLLSSDACKHRTQTNRVLVTLTAGLVHRPNVLNVIRTCLRMSLTSLTH